MAEREEQALRERIEATRERMAGTVEEIGSRVNPDRVRRELKERAREEVDHFKQSIKTKTRSTMRDLEHEVEERGRGIWRAIRENPVPASMVGVGVAWLVANGSSRPDGHAHASRRRMGTGRPAEPYPGGEPVGHWAGSEEQMTADGDSHGVKDRATQAANRVRETGSHAVDRAQHAAEDAVEQTREKVSEWSSEASERVRETRDRAGEWLERTGHRAHRAERRVEDAVQENPLAAGAVAMALGFAAGMMIPESQREHEMFGETRERVLDRARQGARQAVAKAHDAARETAGQAARKAVDEAWPETGSDGTDGAEARG